MSLKLEVSSGKTGSITNPPSKTFPHKGKILPF